jgi:outer membrane biosynthesis protein TonB
MSEFRKGVCKDCDAEFNIPASFTHDRAKCRQCGGTVEVEPAKGAAPKPVPAATPPPSKPEPKVEAPKAEPADKPMTMKEKIIARKKAEAEAAAAVKEPAAPKAKVAPAPKRKKAAPAPAAGGSRRKPAGRKAAGRAGAKRGKRGGDEDGGGRRGRRQKPEKKAPVGGILAILVLVIGGGAAWYFLAGPGKSEPKKTDTVATNESDEPVKTEEELAAEALAAEEALAADEEAAAEEKAATEKAAEEKAAAKKAAAEKAKAKVDDPSTITYDDIPVFGPAIGTTDEEWADIQDLATTATDMTAGARQGRANKKLLAYGYKAFPAICNAMREIDLSTSGGYRAGDLMQRDITELMNGINMGWNYDTDEEGNPTLHSQWFNRKVVRVFLGQWNKAVENPPYWIEAAKLERNPEALEAYQAALDAEGIEAPADEEGLDDF